MRTVLIMGAGGRDFHDFNVVFRDDPETHVVAFTAAQIPGIDDRRYPAALAGELLYPGGIPIRPEEELEQLIRTEGIDEVVLSYSDLSHDEVMHQASRVLAAGADFRLLGPDRTMLGASKPVVAVCAVRTGSGKSQTSRRVAEILLDAGLRIVLVRHPMPYGDLERMRVQRFATLADIDAAAPTIEEREEYEAPVRAGMVVYAGVDYEAILRQAEEEADVIIWDGGNNDLPFFKPDLHIVVVDPLRAGHELHYHPGEANLRLADVVVVNKLDSATPAAIEHVLRRRDRDQPRGARHPRELAGDIEPRALARRLSGARRRGRPDDHARRHASRRRPRRSRTGRGEHDRRPASLCRRIDRRHLRALPAHRLGAAGDGLLARAAERARGDDRGRRLRRRRHRDADRPAHLIRSRHPIRRAGYELEEVGTPALSDVLEPIIAHGSSLSEGGGPNGRAVGDLAASLSGHPAA